MLKPVGENIVIKYKKADEVTASGIVVPGKPSRNAEVLAVGPDVKAVKVNDVVLIHVDAKITRTDDENIMVVCEYDIVAIYD